MTQEEIKEMADKELTLSELRAGSLLHRIASAMVAEHGYYTYTNTDTKEKVFVTK